MIQMSHILVLSQPDLVRRQVDNALSGRFLRLFHRGRTAA